MVKPARLFAALVLLVLLSAPAAAQQGATGQEAAIRGVIERQLQAFQRDDGGEAFSYASPGIQARFGTPAAFMAMVRSGYGAVYRPLEVEFRSLSLEQGRGVQEVYFVGPDGRAALALYLMERQPDGSWRIDGVRLVELPETVS